MSSLCWTRRWKRHDEVPYFCAKNDSMSRVRLVARSSLGLRFNCSAICSSSHITMFPFQAEKGAKIGRKHSPLYCRCKCMLSLLHFSQVHERNNELEVIHLDTS